MVTLAFCVLMPTNSVQVSIYAAANGEELAQCDESEQRVIAVIAFLSSDNLLCLQGSQSRFSGGPFTVVNGALAEDAVCIFIPKAVELDRPIHILNATSGKPSLPASALACLPFGFNLTASSITS